nr:hypothetical protein [Tanacetum cinerariifolium]
MYDSELLIKMLYSMLLYNRNNCNQDNLGDLGIFGDGEVAIIGDLFYGIRFCGIPRRRANVEYAGLVIELYVGGYGVKVMNLF